MKNIEIADTASNENGTTTSPQQNSQPVEVVCTAESPENTLRPIIRFWTTEMIGNGHVLPEETCDVISEVEPTLFHLVGRDRILELCHAFHRSEDEAKSATYSDRFHCLNKTYFDGAIDDFRVRVVYNVFCWRSKPSDDLDERILRAYDHKDDDVQPTGIDRTNREIILAVIDDDSLCSLENQLLHHMAHIATGTSTDDDPRWLREMERLTSLGARVDK